MNTEIRTIEELSMNAWPAMRTLHYEGWVLRFADGYTRRANSIYPLYASQTDLDEKLEFCESFYRDLNQPTIFKMTRACQPTDLDARLEGHGYAKDMLTSLQLLDMTRVAYKMSEEIDLTSEDSEAWHAAYARMKNVSADHRVIHENILRAILPDKRYASISAGGRVIGCGLGVLQAGLLGIFDIIIDPEQRGQGQGTHLMHALQAWGQERGAHTAYLQVMCDNEPALNLYEKLGYQERYQYWYRVKR